MATYTNPASKLFFEAFHFSLKSKSFHDLLRKQEGDQSVWEYPFAIASVNITFMLIQMLDLEAVKPRTLVGATLLKFLASNVWMAFSFPLQFYVVVCIWKSYAHTAFLPDSIKAGIIAGIFIGMTRKYQPVLSQNLGHHNSTLTRNRGRWLQGKIGESILS